MNGWNSYFSRSCRYFTTIKTLKAGKKRKEYTYTLEWLEEKTPFYHLVRTDVSSVPQSGASLAEAIVQNVNLVPNGP